VHHKSHIHWLGIELRPPQWQAIHYPSKPWCGLLVGDLSLSTNSVISEPFLQSTDHRLDSPGITSLWGCNFLQPSRLALGPTQPPIQGVLGDWWGQNRWGMVLTTHRYLALRIKKSITIPVLPLSPFIASYTVNLSFTTTEPTIHAQ
jgi:hypothetical protein